MEVLRFLNYHLQDDIFQVMDTLKGLYGIKWTYDEDFDLFVLNYDQIISSLFKFHPIVCECRSLVVAYSLERGFYCVSRSFDRFFNFRESQDELDISTLTAVEKLDGSLIGIFYHKGRWLYRTKSVIMPVGQVNGWEVTWKDLIDPCIPNQTRMNEICDLFSCEDSTFICELLSPENRVVVKYDEVELRLLAIRDTEGEYDDSLVCDELAIFLNMERPRTYSFDSFEEAEKEAENLPNLEEGFVFYNEWGSPVLKMKSPSYVRAHRLRGESVLTPNRVCDLIIAGEVDEYLAVFPEDDVKVAPYVMAHRRILQSASLGWKFYGMCETQKQFAMGVKDTPVAPLLFSMRKGLTLSEAWDKLLPPNQRKLIIKGLDEDISKW